MTRALMPHLHAVRLPSMHALISVLTGGAAVVIFGNTAGIPAILFGCQALRMIRAHPRELSGSAFAWAGIGMGVAVFVNGGVFPWWVAIEPSLIAPF